MEQAEKDRLSAGAGETSTLKPTVEEIVAAQPLNTQGGQLRLRVTQQRVREPSIAAPQGVLEVSFAYEQSTIS